jgi:hypothetical protein
VERQGLQPRPQRAIGQVSETSLSPSSQRVSAYLFRFVRITARCQPRWSVECVRMGSNFLCFWGLGTSGGGGAVGTTGKAVSWMLDAGGGGAGALLGRGLCSWIRAPERSSCGSARPPPSASVPALGGAGPADNARKTDLLGITDPPPWLIVVQCERGGIWAAARTARTPATALHAARLWWAGGGGGGRAAPLFASPGCGLDSSFPVPGFRYRRRLGFAVFFRENR